MKKFQNIESKVSTGRPGTATTRGPGGGIPRAPAAAGQENNALKDNGAETRQAVRPPAIIAFGKAVRSGSASGPSAGTAGGL